MTDISAEARHTTIIGLNRAVHRNHLASRDGLLERIFTLAFRGLVYPQIWEDPVVDMDALAIKPTDHVVAIGSGGCNVLSYLVANPQQVTAIDLNHNHVALLHLKIAAAKCLRRHDHFEKFFGSAASRENVQRYDQVIAASLAPSIRRYWDGRDRLGRRRIEVFARGLYRTGLLGRFIGLCHLTARFLGTDLRKILRADSVEQQREIFKAEIEPLFQSRTLRWLLSRPTALYGLGIPPAQYGALAGDHTDGIVEVLRARVEALACGFPLKDNYFAWQAFGRSYDGTRGASRPPYLEERNFEIIRSRASRLTPRHGSLTDFLSGSADSSADCFVLLDAQDWMTDEQLSDLWREITRTARPGARVIFRTAADERLLPGRIPAALLRQWTYDAGRSRILHSRDRSAIYGAFHLYCKA